MSSDDFLRQPTDNVDVGELTIKRAKEKIRKYSEDDSEFELFLDMLGLKDSSMEDVGIKDAIQEAQ